MHKKDVIIYHFFVGNKTFNETTENFITFQNNSTQACIINLIYFICFFTLRFYVF